MLLLLSFPLDYFCFIRTPEMVTTDGLAGCLCLFLDISPSTRRQTEVAMELRKLLRQFSRCRMKERDRADNAVC